MTSTTELSATLEKAREQYDGARARVRMRLIELAKRAVQFKGSERDLFVPGAYFDLFESFEVIWEECDSLLDNPHLIDDARTMLKNVQREVFLHYLLSSLGYLPGRSSDDDRVMTANKSGVLKVAEKTVRIATQHPDLEMELRSYHAFVERVFDIEVDLTDFERALAEKKTASR